MVKLAVLVWLEDGCHQLVLNDAQRREIYHLAARLHNYDVKVSDKTLPIQWPHEEPQPKRTE